MVHQLLIFSLRVVDLGIDGFHCCDDKTYLNYNSTTTLSAFSRIFLPLFDTFHRCLSLPLENVEMSEIGNR